MPFAVKARIGGLTGALAELVQLGRTIKNKILRKVLMEVSKPIVKGAKAAAPRETGLLRKSIGRKVRTYRSSGAVIVVVGPRSKSGADVTVRKGRGSYTMYRNPVKYAHLVELGTRPHKLGKGASLRRRRQYGAGHPGTKAHPFLQAGFNAATATATATQRIAEEIAKVTQ